MQLKLVGEIFCHLKRPFLAKNGQKSKFFSKMAEDNTFLGCKIWKYRHLENTYLLNISGIFHAQIFFFHTFGSQTVLESQTLSYESWFPDIQSPRFYKYFKFWIGVIQWILEVDILLKFAHSFDFHCLTNFAKKYQFVVDVSLWCELLCKLSFYTLKNDQ